MAGEEMPEDIGSRLRNCQPDFLYRNTDRSGIYWDALSVYTLFAKETER